MTCCPPNIVCFPIAPIPPPPITPFPGLRGPIIGDISGNPAAPGNVGEFIQRAVTGSLTISTNSFTDVNVTPMSLPPGDWDVIAKLDISVLFTGASFRLNPTVPGMSSDMFTSGFMPGVVHQITTASIVSQRNQLLSASATSILQFDITVANYTAGSVTGSYTFTVNARRMR